MKMQIEVGGVHYQVKFPGRSIAIPMNFDGPQPNTYGVAPATSRAYEQDGWVGDVRRGGSCNFETYTLTPHCNGTHTECIGHITGPRKSVHAEMGEALVPATLITVTPQASPGSHYEPPLAPTDMVVTEAAIQAELEKFPGDFRSALIIRTLPNDPGKKARDYMAEPPTFFTHEAIHAIRALGFTHLLVDFPSVDRLFDEGKLTNHHRFWEMEPGQTEFSAAALRKTITEMIFVSEDVPDGPCLLNLQVAAWNSDAAPSNPIYYPIQRVP